MPIDLSYDPNCERTIYFVWDPSTASEQPIRNNMERSDGHAN